MRSIAIITARGGSKRIPGKNIRDFCGRPIISYSIEAALDSELFDTVMVSTDSSEIAHIAEECGADVPFMRSPETSDDFTGTADVLKEVLNEYEKIGEKYDLLTCIYPTAPFVTKEKLKRAAKQLEETSADSLIPVVQFSYPPQRGLVIEQGKLRYDKAEFSGKRSQDLEPIYHDCGQFYMCRTDAFLKYGSLITTNTCPMIVSELETQDIDNLTDWRLAELKYKLMISDE